MHVLHNFKDIFFILKWVCFEPIMYCEVPGTEKFCWAQTGQHHSRRKSVQAKSVLHQKWVYICIFDAKSYLIGTVDGAHNWGCAEFNEIEKFCVISEKQSLFYMGLTIANI